MTSEEIFSAYIQAFEDSYLDDDWSRLAVYFTPNALYLTGDGQKIFGRDNIISNFKESVENIDRRFDSRGPVFGDLSVSDNQVSVSWNLTYKKSGAPDLISSGSEIAEFGDDAMCRLESVFDEGVTERYREWLGMYGDLLKT